VVRFTQNEPTQVRQTYRQTDANYPLHYAHRLWNETAL
jgi:hypothetical protein